MTVRDGRYYTEDFDAFCEGYGITSAVLFADNGTDCEEIRRQFIRMYVTDNHLPIQYYKDFGWDPVAIDEP